MKSKLLIRHPKSAASTTPLGTVPKKPPLFKPALLPGTDIEAKKKMPPAAITPVEDKLAGLPWSRWTVVDAAGRHYYVSARDGVEAHTRMLADHPEFSSRDITNIVHQ